VKRQVKAPLLLTVCDLCMRRRICVRVVAWWWLCRQCVARVESGCARARQEMEKQGR